MIGKERCDEPITEVWGADIVSFTNLLTYLPGILWASKKMVIMSTSLLFPCKAMDGF